MCVCIQMLTDDEDKKNDIFILFPLALKKRNIVGNR